MRSRIYVVNESDIMKVKSHAKDKCSFESENESSEEELADIIPPVVDRERRDEEATNNREDLGEPSNEGPRRSQQSHRPPSRYGKGAAGLL